MDQPTNFTSPRLCSTSSTASSPFRVYAKICCRLTQCSKRQSHESITINNLLRSLFNIPHCLIINPNKMRYLRVITPQFSRIQKILNLQNPIFQYSKTLASSSSQSKLHELHLSRNYTTASPEQRPPPPERVSAIAEEISGLTLLEVADLTEVLRDKLGVKEMPTMAIMMPGMGFGDLRGTARGGPGADKGEEKKAEKTAFDLKLEGFDAASKIKVIKEVRSFTDLGLKEAKDLVEKAPTLLKKGVAKEEAEAIIAKMKEVGAKVSME